MIEKRTRTCTTGCAYYVVRGVALAKGGVLSFGYTVASTTDRYMMGKEYILLHIVVVRLMHLSVKQNVCVGFGHQCSWNRTFIYVVLL